MRRRDALASILLVMTMAMWGGNIVAARLAVGEISPMAMTCLRWMVASTLLLAVGGGGLAADRAMLRQRGAYLVVMSVCGFTAFNALYYTAATLTSGVNLAILQGLTPILVIAGASLLFGPLPGPLQVVGLLLTLFGGVLVATRGAPLSILHITLNRGDLLILVASTLYAGYTLALRRRPAVSPLSFFTAVSLIAFATSIPLAVWEYMRGDFVLTAKGIAVMLYVGIFPSLIGQVFYIRAIGMIGAGRTGIFYNLAPVLGSIFSVLMLGETFALYHAAALLLVLGGIFLAEMAAKRRPVPAQ